MIKVHLNKNSGSICLDFETEEDKAKLIESLNNPLSFRTCKSFTNVFDLRGENYAYPEGAFTNNLNVLELGSKDINVSLLQDRWVLIQTEGGLIIQIDNAAAPELVKQLQNAIDVIEKHKKERARQSAKFI